MEVDGLFRRVAAIYASCRSYRDRGEVTSVMIFESPRPRHTSLLEFQTAWIRPDRFRFEFLQHEIDPACPAWRYVVWWNGKDIRTWWSLGNENEVVGDLSMALGGAQGISHGTARLVPDLLFAGGPRGLAFRHGEAATVVEDSEGGIAFVVLEGGIRNRMLPPSRQRTWIDERTHLIRRVDSETDFRREEMEVVRAEQIRHFKEQAASYPILAEVGEKLESQPLPAEDYRSEQTIRYWPELDPELAPEVFEFEPPSAS